MQQVNWWHQRAILNSLRNQKWCSSEFRWGALTIQVQGCIPYIYSIWFPFGSIWKYLVATRLQFSPKYNWGIARLWLSATSRDAHPTGQCRQVEVLGSAGLSHRKCPKTPWGFTEKTVTHIMTSWHPSQTSSNPNSSLIERNVHEKWPTSVMLFQPERCLAFKLSPCCASCCFLQWFYHAGQQAGKFGGTRYDGTASSLADHIIMIEEDEEGQPWHTSNSQMKQLKFTPQVVTMETPPLWTRRISMSFSRSNGIRSGLRWWCSMSPGARPARGPSQPLQQPPTRWSNWKCRWPLPMWSAQMTRRYVKDSRCKDIPPSSF